MFDLNTLKLNFRRNFKLKFNFCVRNFSKLDFQTYSSFGWNLKFSCQFSFKNNFCFSFLIKKSFLAWFKRIFKNIDDECLARRTFEGKKIIFPLETHHVLKLNAYFYLIEWNNYHFEPQRPLKTKFNVNFWIEN